ncbi:MAG: nuclear transport factor 2 family protein [Gemmataceae bacterium]|nr:nuclear transport factor 2 family protein [Gemmataceae bacterium]MCI0737568.1 nuclear transport factor 2 family protein [Gemmataceae bacterium]
MRLWLSLCVFAAVATVSSGQEADARKDIQKVLDDQAAAWNKGDLPAFMQGYWQSPKLSFFSGNTKTAGWQQTLERYQKRYQHEDKEMGKLAFREISIELLSADHALVKGRYLLTMKNESPTGIFTLIVKKLPVGWRIIHDHTSN